MMINWEDAFSFDSYTGEFFEWQFFPLLQAYEIPDRELTEDIHWDVIVTMDVRGLIPKQHRQIIISNQFYDLGEGYAYDITDEETRTHVNYRIEIHNEDSFQIDIFRNADVSPFRRLRHLGSAMQQIAPYFDAFIMHGAGIEVNGKGIVFTGFSGVGKSTQARMWRRYRGDTVINGDSPMVRQTSDGVRMFGTPWCGSSGESINRSVPLEAIVLLERSTTNYVEQLLSDKAVLAVYTSLLYFSRNREDFERLFEVYERIIRQIKVFRLYCNMEEDAVDTLERAIQDARSRISKRRVI